MTREEVVQTILLKYSRYGVDRALIEREIEEGEKHQFSYESICTGLRMGLSNVYDTEELFTTREMAEAMGVSEEEVIEEVENARALAELEGRDADEIAYKTTGEKTTYFISSLF